MNEVNIYDPRQMTMALLESFPARRFLTSTFFGSEVHDTKTVDIDIWKGSRRLAPVVHPKMEGKVVDREGYRTKSFQPPYLKPKKVTEADHILKRQPGETIYTEPGSNTPAERASVILGRDLAELEESIARRIEAMVAEAIFTGSVTVKGDGVDTVVDFDFDPTHLITLTGGDLWTATTSNPFKNLRDWKRLIAKDAGVTATDVVMGSDAYEAFISNEDVQKKLDTRRITLGSINPAEMGMGVTFVGDIEGLAVWTYDEWYINDQGNEVPVVPVDKVAVIARDARKTVHYGVIQDVSAGQFATRSFAKSWTQDDPSARFLMVQSAPLPVVEQVNGIVSATVV